MIDAAVLLRSLRGDRLSTPSGQANRIIAVDPARGVATVVTQRSRDGGEPVEIEVVQQVLDELSAGATVPLTPPRASYRSAFVGAAVRTLPFVELLVGRPMHARLRVEAERSESVVQELQRRLAMWAELVDHDDPERVSIERLHDLRMYRSQAGIWIDKAMTAGVAGWPAVTVTLRHGAKGYSDDVSKDGLIYHYPETRRNNGGRDRLEVEATRAAIALRLPVFVMTNAPGRDYELRKAWILLADDASRTCLVEYGAERPGLPAAAAIDEEPFEKFEDVRRSLQLARGRPNQQRFKMQVALRYGIGCAFCHLTAPELITAAHIVADAEHGTSDPRNGLQLCANHHLAWDRRLVWVDPRTTAIECATGHTPESLGITRIDLRHLPAQPAAEALEHRWAARRA